MAMVPEVWMAIAAVVLTVAASAAMVPLVTMVRTFLWEPLRLRRIMAKQGVKGPPIRFFFGDSPEYGAYAQAFPESLPLAFDDYAPTVTPHHALYFSKFGNRFVYSIGSETRLVVRDPEIAKEVLSNKMGFFERSPLELYVFSHVIGNGVFAVKGKEWAFQRRILNPFFSQESLKAMVESVVKGAMEEIEKWEQMTTQAGGMLDYDVEHDIHIISGKIMSYTAFGDEFERGKQIYELQSETVGHLFAALSNPMFWIPGYRLLPTKEKKAMAQLDKRIERLAMEVIDARKEAVAKGERSSFGDDMLGLMLADANFDYSAVVNNCKNLFFAGQDTSANLLSFSLVILANRPEWQHRAREEILEVLGDGETYTLNGISRLKVMGMIVNEVTRVFSISPSITRVALKDFQLGDLFIPKGLAIEVAVLSMHRDPEFWGEDAAEFKPERFANGLSEACTNPNAFLPFGLGPRRCLGEKLALLEVKVVLAMILRRFHILPSPHYRHHPHFAMVSCPKYGVPLVLKTLN
ncbi:hypothetical protein M758_9G058500 [Ceratodon purpureus]|nr:hypothetical protein M758_9G058500 [Ceratodon purpureus]